jgi:hypothetical protein
VSTPEPLPVRLARSLTLSALAVSAAVLAHVLADGHAAPVRAVLVVAAVVTLADLVAGTWLRRSWTVAVRLAGLQVAVHLALSVSAVPTTGATDGHVAVAHHGAAAAALPADPLTWADLLPSAPMLVAHVVVALLVAVALSTTARSFAAPSVLRAVVAVVRRVLGAFGAVPVPTGTGVVRATGGCAGWATAPVPSALGHRRLAPVVVRRGPPVLLPA